MNAKELTIREIVLGDVFFECIVREVSANYVTIKLTADMWDEITRAGNKVMDAGGEYEGLVQ